MILIQCNEMYGCLQDIYMLGKREKKTSSNTHKCTLWNGIRKQFKCN